MLTKEEKFNSYLKSKGLKFTPERKIILEEIASLHKHFNADQLFEKVHKKNKQISRATVYRALPLLAESGLITETLPCQNKVGYERSFERRPHSHLLCMKCGRVIEFKEEQAKRLGDIIRQKYKFEPMKLGIRGYCDKCLSHDPTLSLKESFFK